jgi:hypothetical protein
MSPSRRPSLRAFLSAGAIALATTILLVSPVLAHGDYSSGPSYKATVAPTALAAGTTATSTITLTQLVGGDWSHSKELGSVRITPPAGFTLTGATALRGTYPVPVTVAGNTATVNNLDLEHAGQTAKVTLIATIACGVSGPRTWTVVGHSTYNFDAYGASTRVQDPSSTLTATVAGCSLAFAAQPTTAQILKVITSVAATPAGPPVRVQLRNGNGAPAGQAGLAIALTIVPGTGSAGAILAGTTNANTGLTGAATFAPTIDRPGHDYRFRASAGAGIAPATSAPFDTGAFATACAGACSGTISQSTTTATVAATSTGGALWMSLGLDDVDCNNAANHNYVATSVPVTFNVTAATGRTTVTMKLAKASVTKLWYKYEVCFSSPNSSFVNKYGATIPAGQAGILPSCFGHDCDHPTGGPCVLFKWFDLKGNVYVKFSVPAGDPRGKI